MSATNYYVCRSGVVEIGRSTRTGHSPNGHISPTDGLRVQRLSPPPPALPLHCPQGDPRHPSNILRSLYSTVKIANFIRCIPFSSHNRCSHTKWPLSRTPNHQRHDELSILSDTPTFGKGMSRQEVGHACSHLGWLWQGCAEHALVQ